jgi:hypothetical protein
MLQSNTNIDILLLLNLSSTQQSNTNYETGNIAIFNFVFTT